MPGTEDEVERQELYDQATAILGWSTGVFLMFRGLTAVTSSPEIGTVKLITGIVAFPPARRMLQERLKYTFPRPFLIVFVLVGLLA